MAERTKYVLRSRTTDLGPRSQKRLKPTTLRYIRQVLTMVRSVSLVITVILFATLRNGSVAWWNLLLFVWLGRVERSKVREAQLCP